jgi:hypothetical protein
MMILFIFFFKSLIEKINLKEDHGIGLSFSLGEPIYGHLSAVQDI